MIPIISKMPNVGTSIFTTMSALAVQHNAINLGQGFPNYPMNEALTKLVYKAMKDGHNQYVHSHGLFALRESIAEKIQILYQVSINADTEITITPGGTYAIYTALTSVLQPLDEVIVFEPAYDCYIPIIQLCNAVPVLISLTHPNYSINWNLVKEKITPRTKMIIINTPHNPTGMVFTAEDMQALTKIVANKNIFILSDEVYEHLIFDNKKHETVLKYPELLSKSFVCFSFGKVYDCTGWKLGYCIAPAAYTSEFRKIHQFNSFSCNSPMQVALAQFLKEKENYLQIGNLLQQKRDYFKTLMQSTKFKAIPSFGTYFQLYSYENISNEIDHDFAIRLTKNFGVTAIPVSAFYKTAVQNKVLRFCFSKSNNMLEAAAEQLSKV